MGAPHSLARPGHSPLRRRRLVWNAAHQRQGRTLLSAMARQRHGVSKWSSTRTSASGQSAKAAPTPTTPEPEPSCLALEAQIEECVQQGNVFECQHCASADVGNRCCSCQGSSTSTATLPGTVTETTTTSPALPGQCKAWCASNGKSWEKKCKCS